MNKFIRGFAVVSLFGLLFQAGAYAQLPGDTCALAAGSSTIVNDSNSDFRDVILICDGANWRTMQFPLNRIQDGDNDTFVLVDTADDDVIRMTSVGQPVSTVFATGSDTTFSLSAASATPNIGISLVENGSNSALIGISQATGFLEMDAIAAGSDIIFRSGGTERARLFNTGEFGIGVSASPQAQLDIAGDFRVQGFITPDNTYSSYWLLASDYNYIYVNNRPYLYMYGSSLEYLDIGETGDDANPSEIVIGDNHLYLDQANDRVGINMNDPKATLDVSDLIIVGTTSIACGSAQAGGLRWNSSERCMEVCSGGGWGCNTEVQCSDDIPDAFNFTNETNAALNTLIESDIIQVSGLAQCSITVSIEGAGSPEYRVCNDATCTSVEHDWSNVVNGFANNQYIQVRTTSPRLRQDTRTLNLRVGARATTWSVTVPGACPPDASPVAGSLCADGTVYVGTTTDSGGSSYDLYSTPCRLPRRYIDGSCTGNVSTMP